MIQLNGVSKRYPGGYEALVDVNVHIPPGELTFLTGHSGAGKSTLLKLIAVIERPTSGQVIVDGRNVSRIRRRQIPFIRRRVGFVFQNHRLLYDRSVFDNVALPLVVEGTLSHREIERRVRAALDKVGLLSKERVRPITLSGGEQQRVGIARAVVGRPAILIADEPTGNLDPQLSAELMLLFEQFQQVGTTVLVASHDLDLIARMGKRVLTLSTGRLVEDRARSPA